MPSVDEEIEQNKQELSKLIRTYLNSHYGKFGAINIMSAASLIELSRIGFW